MASSLYNPFKDFTFPENECFLSGQQVQNHNRVTAFPEWIMKRYSLHGKNLTMLAENVVKYESITMPCAPAVAEKLNNLEADIQTAFESGYEAVKELPEIKLFQWMAKLMYGVLYNDIVHGINHLKGKDKTFTLSPLLTKKFSILHFMLQSLIRPMEFINFVPWSISILKINYSKDVFNYKDETKNINFSLGMNGFGIVACLQDNGENKKHYQDLLKKIGETTLHAIQFEEVCALFLYSNYLLNTSSGYSFDTTAEIVKVVSLPVTPENDGPLYGKWDDKTFSQVLANYWAPWGFTSQDIYSFPDSPVSYLIDDYTNSFIEPETIKLPS